jgi:hypothetical protein
VARRNDVDIEVSGVELVRVALASLEIQAVQQLDDIGNDAAEDVAARVRLVMPMGPQDRGHARSSVEVDHAPGLRATVREGGARFPYVGWLDFGGNVGRQHANHRQWIKGGRYLFPSLKTVRPGLEPLMHEGLREAARRSGWNPRG